MIQNVYKIVRIRIWRNHFVMYCMIIMIQNAYMFVRIRVYRNHFVMYCMVIMIQNAYMFVTSKAHCTHERNATTPAVCVAVLQRSLGLFCQVLLERDPRD